MWSGFLGIVSLVPAVSVNLASDAELATTVVLGVAGTGISLWFVVLITRGAFALRGYSRVMSYLETLAETAEYRLWTARTHLGDGAGERRYFEIIEHRLKDPNRRLEDFRRVIRLSPRAVDHISD